MTTFLTRESSPALTDPNPGLHMRILSMGLIMRLRTCDAWKSGESLHVVLARKIQHNQIPALRHSIRERGLDLRYGVVAVDDVDHPTLVGGGHHRLAVLREMGAQWVPVQSTHDHYVDSDTVWESGDRYPGILPPLTASDL